MTFDDWKIEEEDGVSADIEGRKRVLQKQIDRAADELALLEKFADVDFAIGTTLRWLHYNARDKGSDLVKERYRVVVKTGESSWLIVGALAASHIEQIIETFQKDGATVIEVSDGWTELGASK